MKTIHILILFILLALVQIAIPAQMILNRESILKTGEAYKFKTVPIDPADPLKGKYIRLDYENEFVNTENENWQRGQEIFVVLAIDSLGFAIPTQAFVDPPSAGDFVRAKVRYNTTYDKKLYFDYPFDEFYMNENKAYAAEVAYRDAQRDTIPNNAYALVFIKNGDAVLENVFINDIPIVEYIEEE